MKHSKHESKGVEKALENLKVEQKMPKHVIAALDAYVGPPIVPQPKKEEPHSVQQPEPYILDNTGHLQVEVDRSISQVGSVAVVGLDGVTVHDLSAPVPKEPVRVIKVDGKPAIKAIFTFTFTDGAVIAKVEGYTAEWEAEDAAHRFVTNGVTFVNDKKGVTTLYPSHSIQKIEYRIEKEAPHQSK